MRPISQHEPQGPDPSQRQVLALIGNRYVVFGSNMALPGPLKFTPASVRNPVSERVGDEFEPHPERVLKSIQVPDAKIIITSLADDPGWDFELEEGTRKTLVVLKLHARDIRRKEMEIYSELLKKLAREKADRYEIWHINLERLKLGVWWQDRSADRDIPRYAELGALDVWEYNSDGTAFSRSHVADRVQDWATRVQAVFQDVRRWAQDLGLTCDDSRHVIMSEELMTKFAVPDRELPILDVNRGETTVASFVPVGLWIFGSNGRIDVITRSGTYLLLDVSDDRSKPKWVTVPFGQRRAMESWNSQSFALIVDRAIAAA